MAPSRRRGPGAIVGSMNSPPDSGDDRGESDAQRADRNWNELLQELRVSQTGIQLLSGFLMVLPFQSQFATLDTAQRRAYLLALAMSILAVGLFVAPVIIHRLLFQLHRKAWLVHTGHLLALGGLACAAAAIVTVVWLIFGIVLGRTSALVSLLTALAFFGVVWVALPLATRRRHNRF